MKTHWLVAAAAVAVLGCTTGLDDQLGELQRARARWAAQGITTYTFTIRRGCFCAGPLEVEVKVGEVAIVRTDVQTGQPVPAELAHLYPDIPGLFATIQAEIERPAAALSVRYDATRGFPTQISVDPIANAIDDEYGFTITGFRPGL